MDNRVNYMSRIPAEQCYFNIIYLGDVLVELR